MSFDDLAEERLNILAQCDRSLFISMAERFKANLPTPIVIVDISNADEEFYTIPMESVSYEDIVDLCSIQGTVFGKCNYNRILSDARKRIERHFERNAKWNNYAGSVTSFATTPTTLMYFKVVKDYHSCYK